MSDYTAISSRHPGISAARHALRGWRSPLGLATLLLVGVMSMVPPARADIITFIDLTDDTITFSHSGTDTMVMVTGPCPAIEPISCNLILIRTGQNPTSGDFALAIAEDPQLTQLSDQLLVGTNPPFVSVSFISVFGEAVLPFPNCACQVQETGQLQLGATITWSGGGTDSIFFQSDLEPSSVPEPGSWFLLATGLIGLLAFGWRSRAPGSKVAFSG